MLVALGAVASGEDRNSANYDLELAESKGRRHNYNSYQQSSYGHQQQQHGYNQHSGHGSQQSYGHGGIVINL